MKGREGKDEEGRGGGEEGGRRGGTEYGFISLYHQLIDMGVNI